MTQSAKARAFTALHIKGQPVVIYNIWDAGTAGAVAKAGAKALATGSASVAAAHGFDDGQTIPLAFLADIVAHITDGTDLPVSVDFEGAYAEAPDEAAANVARIIAAGAIGINFEDQLIGADKQLHDIPSQQARIRAIRARAGADFFINARTDLFLQQRDATQHAGMIDAAIARGKAYAEAGASGFFVPGLTDLALIQKVTAAVPLPVNIMMSPRTPPILDLAKVGAARVSHGPFPYYELMGVLEERARAVFGGVSP